MMETHRRHIRPRDTRFASSAVTGLVAISAIASCAGAPQARRATPHEASGTSSLVLDNERGLSLESAQPHFDHLGFVHALQVRHPNDGIHHELRDGDTAMTSDRIRVSIQTSRDAYLYLAFCTHQELAIFPNRDGIRTRAGEPMFVPQTELVLDNDPGPEVLYVILSRTELSIADPRLAAALAAKRPSNAPVDCVASLDAKFAKPASHTVAGGAPGPSSTSVVRGERRLKKPLPPSHGSRRAKRTDTASPPLTSPPEEPDFERSSGDIVWYGAAAAGPADVVAADDDGIAVVRHAFLHIAQPPP